MRSDASLLKLDRGQQSAADDNTQSGGQVGVPRPFVDSHHHLWDPRRHLYGWLSDGGDPATTQWIGDYVSLRRPYPLEEFLLEASGSGLLKSVHIEALWGAHDTVEETRWLQGLADARGFPHAIVAAVDLRAPDAEFQIDRHAESPNLRGIRMTQMGDLVARADFRRGFAALAKRDLAYDLNIRYEDVPHALALASAFPQTMIAVDNMANPASLEFEHLRAWKTALERLAVAPNVVMKISGLGMADHAWTVSSVRAWVLTAIDIFSPTRCMFGSNWPVDGLYSSYAALMDSFRNAIADIDADGREAIMRRVAERVYRI